LEKYFPSDTNLPTDFGNVDLPDFNMGPFTPYVAQNRYPHVRPYGT